MHSIVVIFFMREIKCLWNFVCFRSIFQGQTGTVLCMFSWVYNRRYQEVPFRESEHVSWTGRRHDHNGRNWDTVGGESWNPSGTLVSKIDKVDRLLVSGPFLSLFNWSHFTLRYGVLTSKFCKILQFDPWIWVEVTNLLKMEEIPT